MSQRFSDGLAQLHGLASQSLGWRPGEFWRATPEELSVALTDPTQPTAATVSLADIATLMEREKNG